MLKNKEIRYMICAATVFTVAASVCGYVLCGIAAFIILVILGIALGSIFIFFTKRRYNDIDKLNSYLVRVLEGDETVGILDQEEGELSLLKTNIYKTTSTLSYQKIFWQKTKWRWQMPLRI